MKKALYSAALAGVLLLCGCTAEVPEGYDDVKNAKSLYETLDSAHVIMEDMSDGRQLMEFSFYINNDNEMVFSYCGSSDVSEEFAYSNGAEFFYKTADAEGWSVISSSDEGYIYNIYNREYRYPYARGSIFFLDATSVSEADISDNGDGSMTVSYTYDADKLNSYAAEQLDNVDSFSALTTTYRINSDGYITEFTEVGTVTDDIGVTSDVNVKITVDDMNQVFEIPYPVDVLLK